MYAISDLLSLLLYYIIRYRRKVVRQNLTECFPEMTIKEIKYIEKRFYRNFTDYIVETCKMMSMSEKTMRKRMTFTNMSDINDVLSQGRSVALFLGHIFNWEWISSIPLYLIDEVAPAQIYHKLNDESINRIILESRARCGCTNVEMHKTARYITQLISQKKVSITGFIADQSPRRKEIQHYLHFLNHETPVTIGTEKIVRHYDFDAWYVETKKIKRGHYEATFVKMSANPKCLSEFELTEIYYKSLERNIVSQPDLYLWTHRRFKFAKVLN